MSPPVLAATIGALAAVLIALINGLFGMRHTESPLPTVILVPVDSQMGLDPSNSLVAPPGGESAPPDENGLLSACCQTTWISMP